MYLAISNFCYDVYIQMWIADAFKSIRDIYFYSFFKCRREFLVQTADFAGSSGDSKHNILFSPQILLDVGNIFGKAGNLYCGAEYIYW
ncbi:MAG: hypothetical protein NE328_07040 [Lentisphaeraceae bacterium]|nr:hypothetical protein [Lentisphaeraceae bacterium]